MRRRIQHLLSLAGLRGEEITLYLLLMKLHRATIGELSSASGMHLVTAYRTMKRLQDRGLVQALKVNQKLSVYAPLTLDALIQKLATKEREVRRLQLALKRLDHFLPFIGAGPEDARDGAEPIEIYEGLDAFREEYLKLPDLCGDEFLCMGSMQNYWKVAGMSDEAPEELGFRHKRFSRNMFCRVFNTHSPESQTFAKRDSQELRTTRLVDSIPVAKDYLGFTKDHVAHFICDADNPRVVIIRHPELVNVHRKQFEQLWDSGVGA